MERNETNVLIQETQLQLVDNLQGLMVEGTSTIPIPLKKRV